MQSEMKSLQKRVGEIEKEMYKWSDSFLAARILNETQIEDMIKVVDRSSIIPKLNAIIFLLVCLVFVIVALMGLL